jgi:adenosylcobinamide kinase/adenosylcobinamide-phosphate guanylyltransferase
MLRAMRSGTQQHGTSPQRHVAAWRALVLGGARSGKSAFAEQLLTEDSDVLYAATAPRYEGDSEWAERIARHQETRPASWQTAEVGDEAGRLATLLRNADRTVLVDSLTLWLTAAMDAVDAWDDEAWRAGGPRRALDGLVSDLIDAYADSARSVVVVSDEIGLSVVPESAGTRRFRDELGRLNQAFAAAADDVTLVVAGIPLRLKPGPEARFNRGY